MIDSAKAAPKNQKNYSTKQYISVFALVWVSAVYGAFMVVSHNGNLNIMNCQNKVNRFSSAQMKALFNPCKFLLSLVYALLQSCGNELRWIFIHVYNESFIMAIAKVVEVNSSSTKSFEDAIQTGIQKVTETIKNVQGAWINEQKVVIKENKITEYRVNLKISFLVD